VRCNYSLQKPMGQPRRRRRSAEDDDEEQQHAEVAQMIIPQTATTNDVYAQRDSGWTQLCQQAEAPRELLVDEFAWFNEFESPPARNIVT